jgi:hypothetical protein
MNRSKEFLRYIKNNNIKTCFETILKVLLSFFKVNYSLLMFFCIEPTDLKPKKIDKRYNKTLIAWMIVNYDLSNNK